MGQLTKEQKRLIEDRIKQEGLNEYGDPKDTMYAGGNPLFDMMSGNTRDRYDYILSRHRDWLPQSK